MSDSTQQLKPCPFCGNEVAIFGGGLSQELNSIDCSHCYYQMTGAYLDDLVLRWNTRTPDDSTRIEQWAMETVVWLKIHAELSAKYNPLQSRSGQPEGSTTINIPQWDVMRRLDEYSTLTQPDRKDK